MVRAGERSAMPAEFVPRRIISAMFAEQSDGAGASSFTPHGCEARRVLAPQGNSIPADDREDFAGDVTRHLRGGEEDIGRRNLLRLGRTFHWRIGAEFLDVLRLLVRRIKGVQTGPGATAFTRMPLGTSCPDRARVKA